MKETNMKKLFKSFPAGVLMAIVISSSFAEAQQGIRMDAIGEFLQAINVLSGGTRALPSGDHFVENIRARFEIPERIPIVSPHGGNSVLAFVFDSERLPTGKGAWSEVSPDEYRYLQTYHNLKAVYCLHEKEPFDLGDIILAVQADGEGRMSVFFNNKHGIIDIARIRTGNSVFFSGCRYIVKPVGAESRI